MTHFLQFAYHSPRRQRPRLGLSLLELLVVLTILIALGGIVVSTLPGVLNRTQAATASANVPEIDSTVRRNAMLNQGHIGDQFDSLVSGTASIDGSLPAYLGGAEIFETASLSPQEVEALSRIGITQLVPASSETDNATYGSHTQLPVPVSDNSRVCILNPDMAVTLLPTDWNFDAVAEAKYMIVGLGEQSTLVGGGPQAAFPEAPVHFSDSRDENPGSMYSRYLIVIELRPTASQNAVARYVATAIPGREGIHRVSKELRDYYSQTN
ncbi:MAG: hypothetical protein AAFN77_17755 [Planctomycetota bacterium]